MSELRHVLSHVETIESDLVDGWKRIGQGVAGWESEAGSNWSKFRRLWDAEFAGLDFGIDEAAKEETAKWADRARRIVDATQRHDGCNTIANAFTNLLVTAKVYWQRKKCPDMVAIWSAALRVSEEDARKIALEQERRRSERLGNKYSVEEPVVKAFVLDSFNEFRRLPVSAGTIKRLGLALEVAAGFRKGELRNCAKVSFFVASDYKDEWELLGLKGEEACTVFGAEHLLVQKGALKATSKRVNEAGILLGDETIFKPALYLTAAQVVEGVQAWRDFYNVTPETQQDASTREIGRIGEFGVGNILRDSFPTQAAHATLNNWTFNSHFCRKLYACVGWHVFASRIQQAAGRLIDRSRFMAAVLGHRGTLDATLNYCNVEVVVPVREVDILRKRVAELEAQLLDAKAIQPPPKKRRRNKLNSDEEWVRATCAKLIQEGKPISYRNMRAEGLADKGWTAHRALINELSSPSPEAPKTMEVA